MRKFLKFLESSTGSRSARVWVGLLCVLALILGTTAANAASSVPPVILSQVSWLGPVPSGGTLWGGGPAGQNFAVNQNGDVFFGDNNEFATINGQTGASTKLGAWGSTQSVTIDGYNNIYVSDLYSPSIVKVPYLGNGAYAAFNNNPASACTGFGSNAAADTTACYLPSLTFSGDGYYFQVETIAFDAQGDFFWTTNHSPETLWECTVACLGGTGNPVLLYTEPANTATTKQIFGPLSIDPWGNLFFTDIAQDLTTYNADFSYLKELPYTSGTGYAAAPTVLVTYTPGNPGNDEIDGVAVDPNSGTVYFAETYEGIFAFPNSGVAIPLTSGLPTDLYAVSPQGAKMLTLDGKGNLFIVSNQNSADTIGKIALGSLAAPNTATGTQFSVANISAVVNDGAATPALTFTVSSGGQVIPSGITATAGTGAALGSSTVFPVTLQAKPGNVGLQSAVLTATETVNSTSGSANIYVVGQGPMVTVDPGYWNAYTTGFSAPYSVSVDQGGDLAVADETAGKVFELANGTSTWVSIGSGFAAPAATAFDTNSNLYIADFTNNNIVEIPNTSTTGGFTAGTQTTVVSSSVTFGGTALSKPSGLTVGPDGVLYIADLGNKRVVTYNPFSGDTAVRVTGLTNPWGLAVDGAGNLYIANTGGGDVLEYSGGGVVTTLTPAGVTKPWGVVVDPSGSVIISDKATGNIVLVPNEAGTLTDADAITIEKNPSSGYGLAMDNNGNLFTTDSVGKAVYSIWRNQPSLTFGSTNDGTTSAAQTLYVESAGNTALTLGTPFATGLVGPFTEAAGGTNPCADGATTPVGLYCELSAAFAPTGSESGMQAGSFTLNSNAVKEATLTASLSGTAVSILPGQTINFTPPATPVTFGASAVTLVATGGASGNPVTFSLDAASTVGAGSLSGSNNDTLTFTGVGTIVIDANQAGNASYAAAAQVQQTVVVQAATLPIPPAGDIILNQSINLGKPGGGLEAGSNPVGGTVGVNSDGNLILTNTYGGDLLLYNPSLGANQTPLNLGNPNGPSAVAVDANNNIFVSQTYTTYVVKLPYNSATHTYTPFPAAGVSVACTGSDTVPCNMTNIAGANHPVVAMAFDTKGDLFYSIQNDASAAGTSGIVDPNTIWEATAANLYTGTPTKIFTEPAPSGTPAQQLTLGGLAVDPTGNVFFTDASIDSTSKIYFSNLNELLVSGSTYPATATVLYTNTQSTPGQYVDTIDGVAVDQTSGTVYFVDNYSGVFAFLNNGSAIPMTNGQPTALYEVSSVGGKILGLDAHGNLFGSAYVGGDAIFFTGVNNVTVPQTTLNVASNATINAILNDQSCTSPVVTVNSSSAAFTATVSGTCSSIALGGASIPGTVTFTPTASTPTTQTATLTARDNAGSIGTATATGTLPALTAQTISFTAPTVTSYTVGASPITVTATSTSNLTVTLTLDGSSTGTGTFVGGVLTITGPGTFIIDANQAGNATYAAAPQVQLTITATNLTAQTINFTAPTTTTYTYGAAPVTVSASSTSGLTVALTLDSKSTAGAGSLSSGVLTITGPGTIIIDANQAGNGTYAAATQVQLTLTVSAATQVITITEPTTTTFTYGVAPITLAATSTSSNPVVFTVDAASTAGAGSISGSTLTVTGVGTIIVDANQAATADYTAAAQKQLTLTVNQATQTIAFTAPTITTVNFGVAPITLAATGGASSSPIVFTVDAKSTAGAGTIKGSVLTVTGVGTIIVDANQAGTADYSAAAQQQLTITVKQGAAVATPVSSVTTGGTVYTTGGTPITLTSTTTGAAIYYTLTSGSTGTTPTTASTLYTSAGIPIPTTVGTYTIEAIAVETGYASSAVATTTFTVSAIPPSFSLSFSIPSLTITNGQGSGSDTITVNPAGGYNAPITFACTQVPAGVTCSFSPSTITPNGGPVSTTLTVTSATATALGNHSNPLFPAGATLAAALCFFGFRKRRNLKLLVLVAVSFVGLGLFTGCNHTYNGSVPPPITETVVVTATSGSYQQTASFQLTLVSPNQQ